MFELTPLSGIDISIFIALLGALLLYFGRVIGDTKVGRYDKLSYYIEGLVFFAVYIFIPFLVADYTYTREVIKNYNGVLIFIQLLLFGCLSWNIRAHEYLRRHGLLGEFKKRLKEKLNQIKKSDLYGGLIKKGEIKKGEEWFKSKFGLDYTEFSVLIGYEIPIKFFGNKWVLLFFSFLTILSNFQIYTYGKQLKFLGSLFLTFFILTLIAMAYGYRNAYYPPAKIYLDDGKEINGKILKFGDFIYILEGDKKTFVNMDKVKYIEESLSKEKSD